MSLLLFFSLQEGTFFSACFLSIFVCFVYRYPTKSCGNKINQGLRFLVVFFAVVLDLIESLFRVMLSFASHLTN